MIRGWRLWGGSRRALEIFIAFNSNFLGETDQPVAGLGSTIGQAQGGTA